jgi:hypothetical protein
LESKTTRHVQNNGNGVRPEQQPKESVDDRCLNTMNTTITKKYRCLVGVETKEQQTKLCRLQASNTVLTHYLDAQSCAPKTFVSTIPPPPSQEEDTSTPTTTTEESSNHQRRWLKCQLCITQVGDAFCVLEQDDSRSCSTEASRTLAENLWTLVAKPVSFVHVVEIEVELFTGRTHQIRGQLGALGCPIVGDPLYGGGGEVVSSTGGNKRNINVMALQCCAIKFPHPEWNTAAVTKKGKGKRLVSSSTQWCAFQLEQAWWTSHLEESKCHTASFETNI